MRMSKGWLEVWTVEFNEIFQLDCQVRGCGGQKWLSPLVAVSGYAAYSESQLFDRFVGKK